jgi:hypothetical protein
MRALLLVSKAFWSKFCPFRWGTTRASRRRRTSRPTAVVRVDVVDRRCLGAANYISAQVELELVSRLPGTSLGL